MRLITGPEWRGLGLAALAGVGAASGQAPLNLWFVSIPALFCIFWLARRAGSTAQVAWIGWGAGLGYFAAALNWIIEPFLVDIARHGWMAPFALFFLSGGLALLWALAFWVSARFFAASIPALILLWTGAEMLRGVLFTGFPWALIGHVWIDTPVRMIAAILGPHALTLLALLVAGLPLFFHRRWLGGALSLILVSLSFGYGALILSSTEVTTSGQSARLVQPNAPQRDKWDPAKIPEFFGRLVTMTAEPGEVDMIVWPESALAWRLDRAEDPLSYMREAANGTPLIFGANDFVGNTYRNALAMLGPDGTLGEPYYKHHLVPFGEYVPFASVLSAIGIRRMTAVEGGGFEPGTGPELIDIPGFGLALPLICYELIFPRNLRTPDRPNVILQITNDAWFGNLTGPYQHLAQARLRAVEQGLPVLRSANTGVSAVIDPMGRVLKTVPLNETGYIDHAIPSPLAATIYARSGDLPILIFLLVALAGFFVTGRRNSD